MCPKGKYYRHIRCGLRRDVATRARVILPSPPPWHALPNALQKRERYEAGADYLADPLKILIADAPEVAVAEIVSGYIVTPRLNPAGRKEPHHAAVRCAPIPYYFAISNYSGTVLMRA